MRRREAFRLAAGGSAAGLLGARAAGADARVGAGPAGPALAEDHRRARHRHRPGRAAARRGQDHDRPGRPVRLRLRHLHAAGRPRSARGGSLPQAVPRRQARGPDRGHLAGPLRELVLAQRPRPQQRDQRRRHGPLGHQGAAGRDARVPAARREGPRGGGLLRARERGGDPGGARQRPRAHGPRLPARPRPGRRPRHGRLRLAARGEAAVTALHSAPVFEPAAYARRALQLLEAARKELGDEVELLHDVHERLSPTQAVAFCKDVERFRLFFLEDPVSPEDIGWFRLIRQQCTTPLAMGELFNSPHEWVPLISERLIDYIRVHVSQAGGLTPCRKMAALGELVRRQDGLARARETSPRWATPATSPSTSPAPTSASRSRARSTTRRARSSRAAPS